LLGIEELKEKREDIQRQILREEEERQKIVNDIRILNERLSRLEDSLTKKGAAKAELEKTIKDTEAAYTKVYE
jgi:Sjoegren syndrome nuclear autoantigen 1